MIWQYLISTYFDISGDGKNQSSEKSTNIDIDTTEQIQDKPLEGKAEQQATKLQDTDPESDSEFSSDESLQEEQTPAITVGYSVPKDENKRKFSEAQKNPEAQPPRKKPKSFKFHVIDNW